MAAYEVDLSFLLSEWYLPSEDLAIIFQRANFTEVTSWIIETCNLELYAEVQAIADLPRYLSQVILFLIHLANCYILLLQLKLHFLSVSIRNGG